jgi:hypothetical protein
VSVLVVDGANVVGSRPDGWWRDRPGAARRLYDALAAADLDHDEVVLVLEGAARRGDEPGRSARLRVLHAPGSGDDAIVAAVAEHSGTTDVVVVTADRGLRARVEQAGASCQGPRWLLDRL